MKTSSKGYSVNQRYLQRAGQKEWQLPAVYKEPRLASPAAETVTVGSSVELLSRNGLQLKRVVT